MFGIVYSCLLRLFSPTPFLGVPTRLNNNVGLEFVRDPPCGLCRHIFRVPPHTFLEAREPILAHIPQQICRALDGHDITQILVRLEVGREGAVRVQLP